MILPQIESYGEQLNISENLNRNHFVKIMTNEHHQLHSFLPERKSGSHCCSAGLMGNFLLQPELQ